VNKKRKSNKTSQRSRSKKVIRHHKKSKPIKTKIIRIKITKITKIRSITKIENKEIEDKTIEVRTKEDLEDNVRRESLMTHLLKLI